MKHAPVKLFVTNKKEKKKKRYTRKNKYNFYNTLKYYILYFEK